MKKLINVLILIFILSLPIVNAQVTQISLGDNNFIYENNKWVIIDNTSGTKYQVALNSITVKMAEGHTLTELSSILANPGIS